jgi:hypothetical protein
VTASVPTPVESALADLARFVAELQSDGRMPVFTYFTGGFVNVLAACLGFLPPETPVVLVGGQLSAGEVAWIAGLGRPFHHLTAPADDQAVWDVLFHHCRSDFAWIDIDCLAVDPSALAELRPAPGEAARGFFTHHAFNVEDQPPVLTTALLAISRTAVERLVAVYPELGALPASPRPPALGRYVEHAAARVPPDGELEALRRVVPLGPDGVLAAPQSGVMDVYAGEAMHPSVARGSAHRFLGDRPIVSCLFDNLVVFQLLARDAGLVSTLVPGAAGRLAHFGAISRVRKGSGPLGRSKHFDTLCFDALCGRDLLRQGAPPGYEEQTERAFARLAEAGADEEQVREHLRGWFARAGVPTDPGDRRWRFLYAG